MLERTMNKACTKTYYPLERVPVSYSHHPPACNTKVTSVYITVSEFQEQGFKSLTLSRGLGSKEKMVWDARTYSRASRTKGLVATEDPFKDAVFREINAFIATLSGARQQKIWDAYVEIYELFNSKYEMISLTNRLQNAVAKIYAEIPYEELYQWAETSPLIHIPRNIKTSYGENDPVDMTYLRQDYFDLAVLAIASRPMVPIWGEYIPRIKDDVDNTFKEDVAVKLLNKTYIPHCPPYQRLLRFIEVSITNRAKEATLFSAMLAGLSSSNMPEWLLANTLVRRTSMVPISTSDDGPNLITDVYGYVDTTLRSPGHRRFSGPITPKRIKKDDKTEQQESLAESYKIKQEVSDGDVAMANFYIRQTVSIFEDMDPAADPVKLEACSGAVNVLENQDIHHFQKTLVQWVLCPVLFPRYIPLLTKPALLDAISLTQALLWQWGFVDLAALLTAKELKQGDEFVSPQESRSKIPADLMAQLSVIYPNTHSTKEKQSTPRLTNPGVRSIDAAYTLIASSDWLLQAPAELQALTSKVHGSRKMYVPTDIRIQLAQLLIHLYHQRLDYAARSPLADYPLQSASA